MSIKGLCNKYINRLRVKTGYNYKKKDKSFYKSQFRKILISVIIVLAILLIKTIDTGVTNKTIELVSTTVNNTMNFKEGGSKLVQYAKSLIGLPNKAISVFSNQEEKNDDPIQESYDKSEEQYIPPITGKVYSKFGEEKKPNGVTLFHKGIEILADTNVVLAMEDGVVAEAGENKILGKYIRINHGELVAVYGHLEEIKVNKGTEVKKGQDIGRVSDDDNNRKLFYLELWKESTPIDPLSRIDFKNEK